MNQITVLKSNNSFVEAFFITSSLIDELTRISQIFALKQLDLAFLREIEVRVLSNCSRQIKTIEPSVVFALASATFDWFDELLALIAAVEKLPNPHSLLIYLDA